MTYNQEIIYDELLVLFNKQCASGLFCGKLLYNTLHKPFNTTRDAAAGLSGLYVFSKFLGRPVCLDCCLEIFNRASKGLPLDEFEHGMLQGLLQVGLVSFFATPLGGPVAGFVGSIFDKAFEYGLNGKFDTEEDKDKRRLEFKLKLKEKTGDWHVNDFFAIVEVMAKQSLIKIR